MERKRGRKKPVRYEGGIVSKFFGTGEERDRNTAAVLLILCLLLFSALWFCNLADAAEGMKTFILLIIGYLFKSSRDSA